MRKRMPPRCASATATLLESLRGAEVFGDVPPQPQAREVDGDERVNREQAYDGNRVDVMPRAQARDRRANHVQIDHWSGSLSPLKNTRARAVLARELSLRAAINRGPARTP